MKTRQISIMLLLFAFVFSAVAIQAQEMTVKSMVHSPLDQTANLSENMYKDNNGEYGGLVKVMLAASGATFEGWVLDKPQAHSASEYWVFMAKGSSRLKVIVPGYLPLEVDFRDYEDCIIQSLHTYVLTITLPQPVPQPVVVQQDDGMRYLAMTVEPKNSMVFVDDKSCTVDENGELTVLLSMGRHTYKVMADGYATDEGTVNVTDNTEALNVRLESTKATLLVECDTKGALVFINGQQKGTVPWSGTLSEGSYQVEARLDGYRSKKQTITLAQSDNKTITISELQKITGRLNVDCRPLGSDVYVDGKKVGTSPNIFRDVLVGNRQVEIRKEGYESLRKTVEVKENEQATLTGTLTASSSRSNNSIYADNSNSSSLSSASRETFTVNGVSFTMVRVEGGTFMMGATEEQKKDAAKDEKPAHEVTLFSYMIGETEVTQALWFAVIGVDSSYYKNSFYKPMVNVSWMECQDFIKKLNEITGRTFRLPTEAEWEYAARGGNKSRHYKYSGGNNPNEVAWLDSNSGGNTHPVKSKSPNELGLYDMSGNVLEWCGDWYENYNSSPQINPKGPSFGSYRVFRGGSCLSDPRYGRVSCRFRSAPNYRSPCIGLRLAL